MTSRRDFLKYSSLLSAATLMPGFLCSMEGSQLSANGKKLLIIQLSGGCDGLNTVIPFAQDDYYRARPGLGISAGEVLNLNDQQGLNPALAALRPIYDQGQLTILNSVGYPNPDRSHFRSMDIWHTASNSDEYWSHGWLGRYLDADCAGCADPHKVLEI
ncbi:MAG: twin-arginine translocation pathway signal, partial [Bacteroidota bacterium]